MTSKLLDQGDGYLKMKNLRKKEQEESIIMKENMDENMNENMDDNDNNTAYKEGFVESMNNSNDKTLSEMNKEESDTFNRLKSEFDSAMSTYASIQKSIHDESIDYVNKDKNKLQKNYFGRELPDAPSEDDIKYQGCWRDRGTRALPHWKGYMSKEQCAQVAAESGKSVFSLQYGNTWAPWWQRIDEDGDPKQGRVPGKGYCFVGDSMTQAKRYGEGFYRRWRWALSWQNGFQNRWKDSRWRRERYWLWGWRWWWRRYGGGNDWYKYRNNEVRRYNVFLCISDDGRVVLRRQNTSNGGWVWFSGNKSVKNKIQWQQEENVDYPGNDIRNFSNVSVEDCHKKCADDDRCAGHNHWGSINRCWIKHKKGRRNPWNSKYNMDFYTKKRTPTSSFLIVQDDGNVVLYKGTGPADNQGVLFSFRTNERIWGQQYLIKNKKWIEKRKYGRNYITQDQYLKRGEFIASDNGLHVLYLWWDGNILIGSNYTRCRESKGVEVGGAWANSVYTIPKNDIISNLGKAFYKNEDGNKFAYMQKDIRYGTTYKLGRKNWNTWSNDLGHAGWVKTVEQAKAVCNTDPRCAGFVYERVSEYPWVTHGWNRVWKKSKDMWPYGKTGRKWNGPHAYCDVYLRDVKLDNNYSCNEDVDEYVTSEKYAEIAGQGKGRTTFTVREKTDSGGGDIKYMSGATYRECEEYCEADDNCRGFNRKRNMNDGCWIKYDVSRARWHGHWDLYTKNKEVPSGMDGVMKKNTACSIKRSTGQERHILEKKKHVLQQRIADIIKQMKELIEKAKKYNDTRNDGKEERLKMIYEYEQIFKRLNQEEKDLEILNQQEQDEEFQLTSQNYRYISWSIVAILIVIATMKYMKSK